MRCRLLLYLLCMLIFYPAFDCFGQDQVNESVKSPEARQQLKEELRELIAEQDVKIEELKRIIDEIETQLAAAEEEDELEKMLEEAKQMAAQDKEKDDNISKRFHSGVRQQSGLNPNISVSGDFFSGVSSSKEDFVSEPSDLSYGNNRFDMRELELSLVAPLDPFTRGKAFISVTKDEIAIEEAYMEWLNLPLNMNLKAGIFYADFGILNRYHDHALPQFDRPKALVNMFSNAGYGGAGFSANFLLPRLFFSDACNLDVSVVNGGNGFSFTADGRYNLLYSGKLNMYYDLTRDTYFEWNVSNIVGKNDAAETRYSHVTDVGFTVKWAPVGRAKYRTVDWKTEFLYGYRDQLGRPVKSKGFYTSLQNKLNAQYWLTGRVGYAEMPYDNHQSEWDLTACLDYWQSEFVFIRLQYQRTFRDYTNLIGYTGAIEDDHSFIFHVCWAMGPHKHEAY